MERSSFFNAELKGEEYDRVYLAEDYARYFASFIGNGVFPTPSSNLQVVADGTTMNLTLKLGKAWINGYFYENTEDLLLNVDVADGVLNRIDRVVVRLDFINREIKTYIKKGSFASSPVAPTLQRDSDMYELGIADIKINKGATKIVQADITDLRQNSNYCGLVSGVVEQIDTTNLFTQFQSSFDLWFEHIKGQLSEDAAGNLQLQIDTHDTRIQAWEDFKANGGTIEGNITVNDKLYTKYVQSIDKWLRLLTVDGEGIIVDTNANRVQPTTDNGMSLGSTNYKFSNIWIDSFSRLTNGYSKLTNGMILQWGRSTITPNSANANTKLAITFPITFPNFIFNAQTTSLSQYANYDCSITNVSESGADLVLYSSATSPVTIFWMAIGY